MDLREDVNSMVSSAIVIFVGTLVVNISGLFERIILARFLPQSDFGEIYMGISILVLGMTVSMFGLNQGIPRYMSRFDSKENVRGTWFTGFIISLLLTLFLTGLLLLFREDIHSYLFENSDSEELLLIFMLAIPFLTGLRIGVAGIRGMEQTIYRFYTRDILYPVSRIFLLGLLLWLGFGILAAGYAYLIAAFATFVLSIYFLNQLIDLWGPTRLQMNEMVRFSAPLLMSTIIITLLVRTDTLMVGFFQSSAEVGLYTAAYPIAQALLMVFSSFGFLYLPIASRLDADDSHERLDKIYKLTTKWIFIITFPPFILFFAFSGDVLTIFFGEEYSMAGSALMVLSVGFFIHAAAGQCRQTISALGYTKYILIINSLAYILNFILNLFLIPRYSYLGAAIASATAYFVTNVLAIAFLKKQFDINPLSTHSFRVYVLLPIFMLPVAIALSQILTLTVFVLPIALIITGLLTMMLVIHVGGIQTEDEILLTYVEEKIGQEVPMLRNYIPQDDT